MCAADQTLCNGKCVPANARPTEICDNNVDDDCDGAKDCADSDCQVGAACGAGRTCQAGGTCGECSPNMMDSQPCERCGRKVRVCSMEGIWGAWGACTDQKECEPGSPRSTACGRCGMRTDTCSDACTWTTGACQGERGCTPQSTRQEKCGMCGTRTDTCNASCEWSSGSCKGEGGACDPSSNPTRNSSCGKCNRGTRKDTCSASCSWNTGSCSDPDADVGKVTTAYTKTITVTDADENWPVGGQCDPGNRRDSFVIKKTSSDPGTCEAVGPSGGWTNDDKANCHLSLFTLGSVTCQVTIKQQRYCP
jgi:hypothetical protein